MEIEIEKRWLIAVIATVVIGILVIFTLVGRAVTPVEEGKAQFLTPARWHEMKVRKEAARERDRLCELAGELWKELGRVDPVRAQLLRDKIEGTYFKHLTEEKNRLLQAAEAHIAWTMKGGQEDDIRLGLARLCPGLAGERKSIEGQGGATEQGLP